MKKPKPKLTMKGEILLTAIWRDTTAHGVHLDRIDNRVLRPLMKHQLVNVSDGGYTKVSAMGRAWLAWRWPGGALG